MNIKKKKKEGFACFRQEWFKGLRVAQPQKKEKKGQSKLACLM
jgi:hypothetical protein